MVFENLAVPDKPAQSALLPSVAHRGMKDTISFCLNIISFNYSYNMEHLYTSTRLGFDLLQTVPWCHRQDKLNLADT